MVRRSPLLLLAALAACHGMFGARTSSEDQELNNFAAARERALTYYDSKEYVRAASQFKKALQYRPNHAPTRLGYAYSLMYLDQPTQLQAAEKELLDLGHQTDRDLEFKRAYGLGMVYRNLASHYQRRSRIYRDQKKLPESDMDVSTARDYARSAIRWFELVEKDDRYTSLKPDALLGKAHAYVILEDFDAAIRHVQAFADVAAKARKFWEQRRLRLFVVDPLEEGKAKQSTGELTADEKAIYDRRIRRTIEEETTARRALVETYLWLQRYADAIAECEHILALDPRRDETYLVRGRTYAAIGEYAKALDDLREYRKRQDLSKLTDELVRLNVLIQTYETKLKESSATAN